MCVHSSNVNPILSGGGVYLFILLKYDVLHYDKKYFFFLLVSIR